MMEVPIEALPVAVGVLIGFGAWRLVSARFRVVVMLVVSPLAGLSITYLTGELSVSWAFVVFDVGQVLLAALATNMIASRRSEHARSRELGGFDR
jgi:hypothetical protein